MFATRDQENLIHGQQQLAASKPLNQGNRNVPPKTPGNKYPKTPLKIPLRDENAPTAFGTKGKGLGGKQSTQPLVTPMGAKTRAPLGAKTTNAKAKNFQTPAVLPDKDVDKTQLKPASSRRPKQRISHADTVKLDVHGDVDPLGEREVEYCPPKVEYPPYESDIFPDGGLNYDVLKGPNLMRGFAQYYHNPLDEDGESIKAKKMEAEQERILNEFDAQVVRELDEMDWSISDVPEAKEEHLRAVAEQQKAAKLEEQLKRSKALANKAPSTIVSRRAASALSAPARAPLEAASRERAPAKVTSVKSLQTPAFLVRSRKLVAPKPVNPSSMGHTASTAASRSTIGYNKGRTASSVLKAFSPPAKAIDPAPPGPQPRVNSKFSRSVSNGSTASDSTITPERFAQKSASKDDEMNIEQFRRLRLMSAFDVDGKDEETPLAPPLEDISLGDEDEEFVLELPGM